MSGSGPFQDKPSLRVEGLGVARGGRLLFEGLSFAASPGDYVEIRGGNGVGKTTLLRILAGFSKPWAGRVAFDAIEEPALALHFLGHTNGLKGSDSVRAHVRYWRGLFRATGEADALGRLGLTAQADLPARVLSQGQARRLALTRLVIAPRPIWLLDEPASSLDSAGRALLADLIATHRAAGGIAIAAMHDQLDIAPSQTVTLA